MYAKITRGTPGSSPPANALPSYITDLLEGYEMSLVALGRSSTKTIPWYRDILDRYFRFLASAGALKPVKEIGRHELTAYLYHLQNSRRWPNRTGHSGNSGKLSADTIRDHVRVIKIFWNWLEREGYLDANPIAKFPTPKVPKRLIKIITPELYEKLLALIDLGTPTGYQRYCMMLLLYDAGLRISELVNIRLDDIDFKSGSVKVLGKGNKERGVPISQFSAREIRRYLHTFRPQICRADSPYLFPRPDGRPVTLNSVQVFMRRLARKSGIPGLHLYPHLLRHSFGTQFIINGGNVVHLKEIMGHESLATTLKYTHLQSDDLRREHARFSPVGNLQMSKQI